jgi:hypothetical protein
MSESYEMLNGTFRHLALSGSSAEVGRVLAAALGSNPGYMRFFTAGRVDAASLGYETFSQLEASFERVCPGIVDEVHGFAAEANLQPEQVMYYQMSSLVKTNCSQMVALPAITRAGQVLVGRSYEWKPDEDDLCLCTTAVSGRARHIGFSIMSMGRMDGMNEHGLSVTMSGGMAAGLPHEWNRRRGVNFWVVVRGLLENCATTREALERLQAMPPASNTNIVIADRSGRAALAEIAAGELEVWEIGPDLKRDSLVSTNHFVLPRMAPLNRHPFILESSVPRYAAIQAAIAAEQPKVDRETLRTVLAREIPNGCFGPYYRQGFGTLWAQIIDLNALEMEVCFGAPGFNPWRTFTLDTPGGATYPAVFPQRN